MNEVNSTTTTIRVKLETYHKLEELVMDKKKKNLQETGKVGDADFDGVINDLLIRVTANKTKNGE